MSFEQKFKNKRFFFIKIQKPKSGKFLLDEISRNTDFEKNKFTIKLLSFCEKMGEGMKILRRNSVQWIIVRNYSIYEIMPFFIYQTLSILI